MPLVTVRPWVTAGVAIAGAGMIAATPVTPALPGIQPPAIELSALTTGPIEAWTDVLQQAFNNGGVLFNDYFSQPLPVLTQIIVNSFGYLEDLPNIGSSLEQIADNLVTGIQAPFVPDTGSLDSVHALLFGLLPQFGLSDTLQQILNFTASNFSGLVLGSLDTAVISPVLALIDQIQAAGGAFEAGTPLAGLTDLVNIPAAVTGGFLNGLPATENINLLPLLDLAGISNPIIVAGLGQVTINTLGLGSGGLLSPGNSIFGDIAANVSVCVPPGRFCLPIPGFNPLNAPANQPGPLGSLISTYQFIAHEIANPSAASPAAEVSALMNGSPFGDLPTSLSALFDGDLPTSLSALLGELSTDVNGALTAPIDLLSSMF